MKEASQRVPAWVATWLTVSASFYRVAAGRRHPTLQQAMPLWSSPPLSSVKLIFKTNCMTPWRQPSQVVDRLWAHSFHLALGSVRDPGGRLGPRMRALSLVAAPPPPASRAPPPLPAATELPPSQRVPLRSHNIQLLSLLLSGAQIKSLCCREEPQTGQSRSVRHGVQLAAACSPLQEPRGS